MTFQGEAHATDRSGIVLLAVTAVALIWANSPASASYHALVELPLTLGVGSFSLERDLRFWVNDGFMMLFFFAVGLEIRREIQGGELRDLRRAALPLVAALGGMLVPALIYWAFNHGRSTAHGWGVPVATDIAFAVGVLSLLGPRIPNALRVLLLALAVIDDMGAILVITLAYAGGHGIPSALFAVSAGLLLRAPRLEQRLQRPVAYVIMPLFAFSNAGVTLSGASLEGDALWAFVGIGLGLMLGKPIGVLAACWLGARAGIAHVPSGTRPLQLTVIGCVAGIGFTMALFIAQLAFAPGPLLETAKLAVIAGSAGAAVVALLIGRNAGPPDAAPR